MKTDCNVFTLKFDARSCNESFSRSVVCAFVAQLDPTVTEMADIKTAVSEAVTNCIVHAYTDSIGKIYISCSIEGRRVKIAIKDRGRGIPDIKRAMEPEFTTAPEGERSGLGFSVMEAFMDRVSVRSKPGIGTTVTLYKNIRSRDDRV